MVRKIWDLHPEFAVREKPFEHEEIAPFMHLYRASWDGQAFIDALEEIAEPGDWHMSSTGDETDRKYSKYRDSLSFSLMAYLGDEDPDERVKDFQKVALPIIYDLERAVWDYRVKNDVAVTLNQGWFVNKYGHGGQYKIHTDHSGSYKRIFSIIAYLNTVKDGGNTVFPYQNVDSQCVEGNIIVFPSSYPYRHASAPTGSASDEVKYSIVSFFS